MVVVCGVLFRRSEYYTTHEFDGIAGSLFFVGADLSWHFVPNNQLMCKGVIILPDLNSQDCLPICCPLHTGPHSCLRTTFPHFNPLD